MHVERLRRLPDDRRPVEGERERRLLRQHEGPQILPQTQLPTGATGKSATAHMVIGQLNGATVPVIVRTGNVNLGTPPLHLDAQVDDESGIAVLGAATAITSGAIDGGYAGADSNFKYGRPDPRQQRVVHQPEHAGRGRRLHARLRPGDAGPAERDDDSEERLGRIGRGNRDGRAVRGADSGHGERRRHVDLGEFDDIVDPYFGVGAQISK